MALRALYETIGVAVIALVFVFLALQLSAGVRQLQGSLLDAVPAVGIEFPRQQQRR